MTLISESYQTFMSLSDSRVKDWPFMSEPWTGLGILVAYLYGIYVWFPNYMVGKKPYKLKSFIAAYNIIQVLACGFQLCSALASRTSQFGCQEVEQTDSTTAAHLARLFWWNFIIKAFDLIETFVFILRKKDNQVSVLHVYHHVTTFILAWGTAKFSPTCLFTLPLILNSSVHVIMYSYYYLASLGPSVQKKLSLIKSKITIIQIIQLFGIVAQQIALLSCKSIPTIFPAIGVVFISIDVILFVNFFVQNYLKKNKEL